MKNYWVLVLFAGVAVADPTTPPSASYDQVVAAAVNTYNQEQNPEYAFRLLEAEPQPDWQTTGETTQPLKFSIKETLCRSSEKRDVSQCDYKEDGVRVPTLQEFPSCL
ncbi:hypothetical protein JRQ81_018351 [Phrynocephalus forsythii]|uniref:Vipericidin n=1 Tax=Phrynocephalus forsythii TaxID=171643 RepID=A0A9Q0XQD7_9SAUR|nr:hypothetical protein JRQ81_018351 [Phrynocephalus forsythii]